MKFRIYIYSFNVVFVFTITENKLNKKINLYFSAGIKFNFGRNNKTDQSVLTLFVAL